MWVFKNERWWIRKVSCHNLLATYWQPSALQHQRTTEKANPAHPFQQGWNWEVRGGKLFAQDSTTGHRLPSDCCVLKDGISYSNPSFLTCHQATLSNTLGFLSYSQPFITVVTDLLVESGSVCTATPTQKIWKPLMCDFHYQSVHID